MNLFLKGMTIQIEHFHLFYLIKDMTISIDFQAMNLFLKGMAVRTERFYLFHLIKGMSISIDFQAVSLFSKCLKTQRIKFGSKQTRWLGKKIPKNFLF